MKQTRYRSYVICTSPRSGSTLLCSLLKETGAAGRPGSLFHTPSLEGWLNYYGLADASFGSRDEALRAVFVQARKKGTGNTDLFGLRMQRPSFAFFMEQLHHLYPGHGSDVERIEAAFGPALFVSLSREDKLAQAISLVIAEQSGLWHRAADGSELERLAAHRDPEYDRDAIARHMAALAAMDVAWAEWFEREGLTPLRIGYQELSSAPQATLARVLQALGIDPVVASRVETPTAKLADTTNREWMERFSAEDGR